MTKIRLELTHQGKHYGRFKVHGAAITHVYLAKVDGRFAKLWHHSATAAEAYAARLAARLDRYTHTPTYLALKRELDEKMLA